MSTGMREIDVLKARWSSVRGRSVLALLVCALAAPPLPALAADLIVLCPRAVETAAMPPAPSGERISYGPSLSPVLRGITFRLVYRKTSRHGHCILGITENRIDE